MFEGSILALDIGGFRQHLLIWEPGQDMEDAVKMVIPAPTRILARRLQRLTEQGQAIFLTGRMMGGGAVTQAVRHHLSQGLKVYATPQAALTLNDRPEIVQQWGVIITEATSFKEVPFPLGDINMYGLSASLSSFEISLPDNIAVALLDHGFHPEGSNRRVRFKYWKEILNRNGKIQDLAFREPPPYFKRMSAVAEALPGALLMDTCAAGVYGALLDPRAREQQEEGLMVVYLGNAHTFAVLVQGEHLWGIYEHHTRLLNQAKLFSHLARFQGGELTNTEVFADYGHGCAYAPGYSLRSQFSFTVITGPRRHLAHGWPGGIFAAPFGDMTFTGCFGLITAFFESRSNDMMPKL